MITDIKGTFDLHNGVQLPYLGLGTWKANNGPEVENAISYALDEGYRLIDTASFYGNEEGVGKAIRNNEVSRSEVFVTTKVWNDDQGYEETLKAYDESLKKLGMDYVDLYLIHWPVSGTFKATWKALEKIYEEGRVRAIGVSNFLQSHFEELLSDANVKPMLNQMEFHPYLVQQELVDFCHEQNIVYQAWSPIMQGRVFNLPELKSLSKKYKRSQAQIVLRWDLQKGIATIPKSTNQSRIESNAQLFDFELSQEDMKAIDKLDKNHRYGIHPGTF